MSHTPGPWHWDQEAKTYVVSTGKIKGDGIYVAFIAADAAADYAITEVANACLIAAAPELLEACIKMVARFQELSQDRSICVAPELAIMADAIAHAEEQP